MDPVIDTDLDQTSEGQSEPAIEKSSTRPAKKTAKAQSSEGSVSQKDFRAYQARMEQQLQAALQAQRQLEQAYHQTRQENMSDAERAQYQRSLDSQRLLQELESLRQENHQYKQETLANAELEKIRDTFGTPMSELRELRSEGLSPADIWIKAYEWKQEHSDTDDDEDAKEDKRRRNKVDVGGNKRTSQATELSEQLEAARKSGDAVKYIQLLRRERELAKE